MTAVDIKCTFAIAELVLCVLQCRKMYQHSLLVIVIILTSAVLSSAQDDLIYKVFPVNISCNRNATVRQMERSEINSRTGRTTL